MLNNNASQENVSAVIAGLPAGFGAGSVSIAVRAGEKKAMTIVVDVDDSVEAGTYNARLIITGGGETIARDIQIVRPANGASTTGITSIVGTAFSVLSDNAPAIVFVLVLLVLAYLAIKIVRGTTAKRPEIYGNAGQPWVSRK